MAITFNGMPKTMEAANVSPIIEMASALILGAIDPVSSQF